MLKFLSHISVVVLSLGLSLCFCLVPVFGVRRAPFYFLCFISLICFTHVLWYICPDFLTAVSPVCWVFPV